VIFASPYGLGQVAVQIPGAQIVPVTGSVTPPGGTRIDVVAINWHLEKTRQDEVFAVPDTSEVLGLFQGVQRSVNVWMRRAGNLPLLGVDGRIGPLTLSRARLAAQAAPRTVAVAITPFLASAATLAFGAQFVATQLAVAGGFTPDFTPRPRGVPEPPLPEPAEPGPEPPPVRAKTGIPAWPFVAGALSLSFALVSYYSNLLPD
jgi:hypothetical protein